ncbi:hypothetical protein ACFL27_01285 [candidate division CSSED10-310 bacterium]|uniref:Uncharacterized protein n=1 Tax=candidate division CSSED10-310 bacterium TaxID=2855610 RepID=A0ABV6YRI3_UNCC1
MHLNQQISDCQGRTADNLLSGRYARGPLFSMVTVEIITFRQIGIDIAEYKKQFCPVLRCGVRIDLDQALFQDVLTLISMNHYRKGAQHVLHW